MVLYVCMYNYIIHIYVRQYNVALTLWAWLPRNSRARHLQSLCTMDFLYNTYKHIILYIYLFIYYIFYIYVYIDVINIHLFFLISSAICACRCFSRVLVCSKEFNWGVPTNRSFITNHVYNHEDCIWSWCDLRSAGGTLPVELPIQLRTGPPGVVLKIV